MAAEDGVLARTRALALSMFDVVPGLRRLVLELARIELIDRMVVLAAQALFSVTPLLIVVAAFSPDEFGKSLTEQLADVMGVPNDNTTQFRNSATVDQVRTQTGIVGIVLVVVSALSFARALQRMYERAWQQPHMGGLAGNRRCLLWLVSWVVYLELLAAMASWIHGGPLTLLRLCAQIVLSTFAWWWTSRMLLLGRIAWPDLLLGAILTAVGLSALTQFSRLLMPPYVAANVAQFGTLGVVLAASTWLLAFGGVLVVATTIGRVYTEELSVLGPLRILRQLRKQS